jgi:hypothetical protein
MRVPNIVHFVYGLAPQTEPFRLVHYLAIESCRRVLQPEAIYFHYDQLPYGAYWDLVRPCLTLRRVAPVPEVLTARYDSGLVPEQYRYAHHADFVRLDALIAHGGVYADIDTMFVRPYPSELFEQPFVIGSEGLTPDELDGRERPSFCNAVLLAEPGSVFARTWRQEMGGALNGTWSNHSGFLPYRLSRRMPREVHVEPRTSFFAFPADRDGLAALFTEDVAVPDGCYSIHLWEHLWYDRDRRDFTDFHGGLLTAEHLACADSTYARLARPLLPELATW